MDLYLLKHGESQANVARVFSSVEGNWPLSVEGRRQARTQAGKLAKPDLEAIYCSTLSRTRETADIVGSACDIVPAPSTRLVEVGLGG